MVKHQVRLLGCGNCDKGGERRIGFRDFAPGIADDMKAVVQGFHFYEVALAVAGGIM